MKKTPRDVIILHKCTKNHDHMLYCSWDMACDGCDCYFSFWAIFCPYPPPLPTAQKKWKVQKNEKNPWIYHLLTQSRVIPCEFTRILKIFPPDPHGFSWNFVRWMYPSRNENPENFIILSCAVQKLWPTEMWSFTLDTKPLNFFSFWSCFYSAIFNRKHLKFGLAIHFHMIISKKIYLAKNFMKQVCAGVLKLPNLPLCFYLHFQRAISWQGKI